MASRHRELPAATPQQSARFDAEESPFRRDAETSGRDARATQALPPGPIGVRLVFIGRFHPENSARIVTMNRRTVHGKPSLRSEETKQALPFPSKSSKAISNTLPNNHRRIPRHH